jgi:hypothetical protein
VRTFFQTAVVAAKRQDGQIMIREFDHLDKTKDLANIGAHGSAAGAPAASRKKGVFDASLQWVSLEWYLGSARSRLAPS